MPQKLSIRKISLIGSGNVASHLGTAFLRTGMDILQVYAPSAVRGKKLANELSARYCEKPDQLETEADLYLMAVPDAAIAEVAGQLPNVRGIVAHTSGITAMQTLGRFKNYGVFYPLQTFTRGRQVDLSTIPICLEASGTEVMNALTALAKNVSELIYQINSGERRQLHLAAVMVNNFPNHLYHMAAKYLANNGLDFSLLHPLILETASKVQDLSPAAAQTGPARRGDSNTIQKHLELLADDPETKEIYRLFSEQIKKTYNE